MRITAPSVLFKSEAIVHPDEVVRYVGVEECQISYNPTLMALCWESLATRHVKLLVRSLSKRHKLPAGTTWVNYLRCHDDIGWTFDDADAAAVGINAYDHRQFLNEFYTGQFPGSFARGVPFQHNIETGDMRISGTMASLAGLELAIEADDQKLIDIAIRRILLLHATTLSVGGIPLIYLGEEWGMLNDYDFIRDPAKAGDTRWIHRPKMRWEFLEELQVDGSIRRRIFTSLKKLFALRKSLPALAGLSMDVVNSGSPHVLAYTRQHDGNRLLMISNFADSPQSMDGNLVRTTGLGRFFLDRVSGQTYSTSDRIPLEPYGFLWLERT